MSREATPKHPAILLSVTLDNTVWLKLLSLPPGYVGFPMASPRYPCLVGPQDIRPLIWSPINMLECKLKSKLPIFLRDRGLPVGNIPTITQAIESKTNSIFAENPVEEPYRQLKKAYTPIFLRGSNEFDKFILLFLIQDGGPTRPFFGGRFFNGSFNLSDSIAG